MTPDAPNSSLGPLTAWLALLALLGASVTIALTPFGHGRLILNIGAAVFQALIVAVILMRLDKASSLVRLIAASGLAWASLIFILAGADYLTRR